MLYENTPYGNWLRAANLSTMRYRTSSMSPNENNSEINRPMFVSKSSSPGASTHSTPIRSARKFGSFQKAHAQPQNDLGEVSQPHNACNSSFTHAKYPPPSSNIHPPSWPTLKQTYNQEPLSPTRNHLITYSTNSIVLSHHIGPTPITRSPLTPILIISNMPILFSSAPDITTERPTKHSSQKRTQPRPSSSRKIISVLGK
ncbi:hypothetical protein Salat_1708700 [Sesamum alatum]|uniref:Uncharacterized protein n=1 Tax=Sesamum alatum TaxID=300844 RepID=A0AAE2CK50_9LAMI|nr:hypothetical protein Salat_1708700 [Sesamum alatum]